MVKVLMHVVGYSSILPKDWKRMQYSMVKYLRENMGQERCTKKWGYACLVAAKVVEICRRTLVALQLLDLTKQYNNGGTQ